MSKECMLSPRNSTLGWNYSASMTCLRFENIFVHNILWPKNQDSKHVRINDYGEMFKSFNPNWEYMCFRISSEVVSGANREGKIVFFVEPRFLEDQRDIPNIAANPSKIAAFTSAKFATPIIAGGSTDHLGIAPVPLVTTAAKDSSTSTALWPPISSDGSRREAICTEHATQFKLEANGRIEFEPT